MTVTPGLVTGLLLLAAAAGLIVFGRRLAGRWPREQWLVSLGRVLAAVAGVFLVATATVLARADVTCGIVVAIDQASLTDVHAFTLRTSDGVTVRYTIEPGRLAPDSFGPGHLREHLAFASPVCVTHSSGGIVALDLRDQLASPSP